jgi:UDP-N-acetylglucosamine 4,6-dehydratase
MRFFIGDIRDPERLKRAFKDIDYVIHAAALKQVDTGEYNPMEFIKTNVLGSQNVIDASIETGVKRLVALSTDKASSPINLYGATKLTADKLFIAANNYSYTYGTTFSVVRYGNVMGSRGSVVPFFKQLAEDGKPLPITDLRMTRFWISIDQAVRFVVNSLEMMTGGELYVPRIPSMKIVDLARAIGPESELVEIGTRPGEKLHEEMISAEDSPRTKLIDGSRYVVLPVVAEWNFKEPAGESLPERFAYASDTNNQWMTVSDIQKFITAHH